MVLTLSLSLGCNQVLARAAGSTTKMAYSHGYWQEASVSCHVSVSIGKLASAEANNSGKRE